MACAWAAAPAAAVPAYDPGRVLVGREGGAAIPVALPDGAHAPSVAAELARQPGVAWAEPDWILRAAATPADPLFGMQWALQNTGQRVNGTSGTSGADIAAAAAWDRVAGDAGVLVAVVDTGVDLAHPDLVPNLALNAGEAGAGRERNGVDDDGNGVVDDLRGFDFADGDADPTEVDPSAHGTHVTGTLGAAGGNGTGVTGVAQRVSVVPVRALDAAGAGRAGDIAAAFRYAASRGARVVNASLGGESSSSAIEAAIRDAPNTLFVVAAGNEGRDLDRGGRSYPCDSPAENVLCVTATDQNDAVPRFANTGRTAVDLGAPGVNVLSTVGGGYGLKTGTSMAAPHAVGVAALALAASPGLSTQQLRGALVAGAVPVPALTGRTASGRRLSAAGTLAVLPAPAPGPPALTQPPQDVTATSARLIGATAPAGRPAVHHFELGTTTAYGRRTPQRPTGTASLLSEAVGGLAPGTTYHARLVTATAVGVSFGPDVTFTTTAPPATAAAPVAAAATTAAREPVARRPRIAVGRIGRSVVARLTLSRAAVVSGRLERARPGRTRARPALRGFRRRGLGAGRHVFALGRLDAGRYRVAFTVTQAGVRVRVTRTFRVGPPPAGRLSRAAAPGASRR